MEELTPRDRQRYFTCLGSSVEDWGLKSVENEYKNTKIKAALKLYWNADPTIAAVRSFEKLAVQNGRYSIIENAKKYAEELDLQLWLNFPNLVAVADGKEVEAKKVKQAIYKAPQQEIQSTVSEERWQGRLIKNRWDDEKVKLEECFEWLSSWKNAITHTIAGVPELYQGLLQQKNKIPSYWRKMPPNARIPWRMWAHSGCNDPWQDQQASQSDEMSCPWLENRELKDFEKTRKYSQLRPDLTNRFREYKVNPFGRGWA